MEDRRGLAHRKLTREEVIWLRILFHVEGMHLKELAAKFDISYRTVHAIVRRETYKEIPMPRLIRPRYALTLERQEDE